MEASETSIGTGFVAITGNGQPIVSIVVPAFNEAKRIGDSIRKIDAFVRQSPSFFEVIVVDDGSVDGTAGVVSGIDMKGLRLIRNNENHGKGYTVRQGVLAASGKYVLFTDADLSAPIDELTKLLEVAVAEDADVVIGSRKLAASLIETHQSGVREIGAFVFNCMVRVILGLRLHDTQCGFKLFHRQRSRRIFEKQTRLGFGFDPELLFLAKRHGLRIRETPVRWSHSEGSKVKVLQDGLRMFFDLVRIRWNALTGRYS
ncbi:MAG TPA: dolichyl-phosphate beta-glucosyltransferase [Terriglobia bacterium]|nr:dolichyl-phosphate beta-glucosyltransferase [Terriglobia bacterium]